VCIRVYKKVLIIYILVYALLNGYKYLGCLIQIIMTGILLLMLFLLH
jgi:hypothetical protein